ncbi:MAG: hypothetical protein ACI86H_002995, partial [bacterium]
FSCTGTGLSQLGYRKAKKYLKSLNLVKNYRQNRTPNGTFGRKAYIKINYLRHDPEKDIFSHLDSLDESMVHLAFLGIEPSEYFNARTKNTIRNANF